jgi:SAM-dependent methyltransferase
MLDKRQICRICGPSEFERFMEKNSFHLERCLRCKLVQVTDNLENVNLADYYGKDFFDENYMWLQAEGKGRAGEYRKFNHRLDEIENLTRERGHILDVGCSFGFFLDVARSRGWKTTGVEIGEYAAQYGVDKLQLEIHACNLLKAPLPKNSIDVVAMWNVLEHLDNPLEQFKFINRLLRPGGLVVFTTGDVDSYLRHLQVSHWRAFIPPIHLSNYSIFSIKMLFHKCGFELVHRSVALPKEYLLKRIGLLRLLQRIKFSDKMMIFGRKFK